jgi:hypothetical protein
MIPKIVLVSAMLVSVSALLSSAAYAAVVTISEDRMLLVDGKRTFLLGLYGNPEQDPVLKQVADAGFSLVYATPETAALDRLQRHGLHAWLNTGSSIDLSDDRAAREGQLRTMVDKFAGHPALLAWEVPDEALWNAWYGPIQLRYEQEPALQREKIAALSDASLADQLRAQRAEADRLLKRGEFREAEQAADAIWRKVGMDPPMRGQNPSESYEKSLTLCKGMSEGYALLKQLDANHPIWMNYAPRNNLDDLSRFAAAADVVGCDIYPVPEYVGGHSDLMDRSLSSVGAYTTIMQQSATSKPVWMVLQGFGWADLDKNASEDSRKKKPRPTFEESRFMAYDAIVHGARGILYWGTAYIEKDSPLWSNLLKLVRELADLQPVLSARDAAAQPDLRLEPFEGSGQYGIRVLAKQLDDASVWYLIVNECSGPRRYSLSNVAAANGTVYHDPVDNRTAAVTEGKLSLSIAGHGVQILRPRVPS